jgi:hypothetical protein
MSPRPRMKAATRRATPLQIRLTKEEKAMFHAYPFDAH